MTKLLYVLIVSLIFCLAPRPAEGGEFCGVTYSDISKMELSHIGLDAYYQGWAFSVHGTGKVVCGNTVNFTGPVISYILATNTNGERCLQPARSDKFQGFQISSNVHSTRNDRGTQLVFLTAINSCSSSR